MKALLARRRALSIARGLLVARILSLPRNHMVMPTVGDGRFT